MPPVSQTRVITVDPERFEPEALAPAVEALRGGGLVGMPTETVYGIAVDLEKPESVRRLLELRGSPAEKKITVHIGAPGDVRKLVPGAIPAPAQRLIKRFWPGPLTIVFPTADREGLGVRCPSHRVAAEIVRRSGLRVGAPSANLAGQPPAVTGEAVVRAFDGRLDVIVDSGPTRHQGASTVARVEGTRVEILREGAIPRAMVEEANIVTILFVCTGNTCRSPMAAALLRHMLAERLGAREDELESRGWRVHSAGTGAGHGIAASEGAQEAVRRLGADLSGHRSRPVSPAMVEEADRVFVMTAGHRDRILEYLPDHAAKVELLDPAGREVEDPIGEPDSVYAGCAGHLRAALAARIKELTP